MVIFAFVPAAFAQSGNPLSGTNWDLAAYGGMPVADGAATTLVFVDDTQATGSGGCNSYGGSYALEGDAISFSGIASTLMMCADEAVGAQETAYFEALNTATRYELTDEGLTIWYGDGQELEFVTGKRVVGPQWLLESIGDSQAAAGSIVTLKLGGDGVAIGSGGCNMFSGTYTLSGDTVTFSPLVSTRMACADDAATQQETAFLEALQTATRYELTDEGLTIWYGDGQALHFVATLAGTQWQLESIREAPVVAESVVTLAFGPENAASGTGGCNNFNGTYEVDGEAISFSPLVSTMMACVDGGISEQEAAFFEALQGATRYQASGDQLTIWYGDGQALTFMSIVEAAASG
jgi:putative lipoprotein